MSLAKQPAPRRGIVTRNTKETQITLAIRLDEPGEINIQTDLPFLTHMLDTLACHGRFGLDVKATGDIHVDPHHLVEDCGIMLGMALSQALGDFKGIQRAGFFIYPMDRTLATVSLDLCGRPNLVWNVPVSGHPVGNLDPRLFKEFYKGLVDALRMTLHASTPDIDNDHHAVEAVFKGFARALRMAVTPLEDAGVVLSTKGTLEG